MPTDSERLPAALVLLAEAIEIVIARTRYESGYQAYGYPEAPWHPIVPGQPPFDGVYRGSFLSKIICARFDLRHPAVSAELGARLRRDFPEQVGGDLGFYEYSVDERASQRENRDRALASLAGKIESRGGA